MQDPSARGGFAKKRVVITGMGIISPLGNSVESFWNNLIEGKSGVSTIESFDASDINVKIAGEVKNFNAEELWEDKEARSLERFAQFALAAAEQALGQSRLSLENINLERLGVYVGTATGGTDIIVRNVIDHYIHGRKVSPNLVVQMLYNMAASSISIRYGALGPAFSLVSACSSANMAIGEAYKTIQNDEADVMFAGGTEAVVNKLIISSFSNARALSTRNDTPTTASRPFSEDRDGFVMSEGGAILLLESLEHALNRDAPIIGEIIGYSTKSDAYHSNATHPEGYGGALAMKTALSNAGITIHEVDIISAHATSTKVGDISEAKAIHEVFKERAEEIPVVANKSALGHSQGASSAMEAVALLKTLEEGIIPPTINVNRLDPRIKLNVITQKVKNESLNIGISNSFGFGSHCSVIVLKKYQ